MTDYTDDRQRAELRAAQARLPHIARLSDLHDFEVASGYPDVRGWDLVTDGRHVGKVKDLIVDTHAMRTRYLEAELDDDIRSEVRRGADERRVLIPIGAARLEKDHDRVFLGGVTADQLATLPGYSDRLLEEDTSRFAHDDFDDRRFYEGRRPVDTGATIEHVDAKEREIRIPLRADEEVIVQKRRIASDADTEADRIRRDEPPPR